MDILLTMKLIVGLLVVVNLGAILGLMSHACKPRITRGQGVLGVEWVLRPVPKGLRTYARLFHKRRHKKAYIYCATMNNKQYLP